VGTRASRFPQAPTLGDSTNGAGSGGALKAQVHYPRLETSYPEKNQARPSKVATRGPWSEGSPRSPKYQEWRGCTRHLPQSDTVKETSRTTLSDGEAIKF